MMTIEELEKKLTELDDLRQELNAQIAELKLRGEEKPMPPHPRPELKQGDNYFYITADGTILSKAWFENPRDYERRSFGNVFTEFAAALYAGAYYTVLAQMREWAGKWDDPWVMIYDGWSPKAISIPAPDVTFGELRFATKEDAENCIKAVGKDRLIKYYFGVRDHEADAETE